MEANEMKVRRFSDTVSGRPRVIIIIDNPNAMILEKLDHLCDQEVPLPGTKQENIVISEDAEIKQEQKKEEPAPEQPAKTRKKCLPDQIWKEDEEYLASKEDILKKRDFFKTYSEIKTYPRKWYHEMIVSSSLMETLINLDAMYLAVGRGNAEFCSEVRYLIPMLKKIPSLLENPESVMKHIPCLSAKGCEKAMKQNRSESFHAMFGEYDDAKKRTFLMGLLDWISNNIEKI